MRNRIQIRKQTNIFDLSALHGGRVAKKIALKQRLDAILSLDDAELSDFEVGPPSVLQLAQIERFNNRSALDRIFAFAREKLTDNGVDHEQRTLAEWAMMCHHHAAFETELGITGNDSSNAVKLNYFYISSLGKLFNAIQESHTLTDDEKNAYLNTLQQLLSIQTTRKLTTLLLVSIAYSDNATVALLLKKFPQLISSQGRVEINGRQQRLYPHLYAAKIDNAEAFNICFNISPEFCVNSRTAHNESALQLAVKSDAANITETILNYFIEMNSPYHEADMSKSFIAALKGRHNRVARLIANAAPEAILHDLTGYVLTFDSHILTDEIANIFNQLITEYTSHELNQNKVAAVSNIIHCIFQQYQLAENVSRAMRETAVSLIKSINHHVHQLKHTTSDINQRQFLLMIQERMISEHFVSHARNLNIDELTNALSLSNRYPAHIDSRDGEGNTALMVAAAQDEGLATVNLLLERGANPNLQNSQGSTALHIALQGQQQLIVKSLMNSGANLNIQDENGNSPLMLAVSKNQFQTCIHFLDKGADPNLADRNGNTALIVMTYLTIKKYKKAGSFHRVILSDFRKTVAAFVKNNVDLITTNTSGQNVFNVINQFANDTLLSQSMLKILEQPTTEDRPALVDVTEEEAGATESKTNEEQSITPISDSMQHMLCATPANLVRAKSDGAENEVPDQPLLRSTRSS